MLSKDSKLPGLISILDYHFTKEYSKNDYEWFLMPLAKPFSYNCSLEKRIDFMLSLGKTIKALHNNGYVHRDIKPGNLLVIDNNLYLSDYGLLWNESSEEHITDSCEVLGPANIRPPEFEYHRNDYGIDYKKSDVYLFAKTVWIVLRRNRDGFRGEYNRSEPQIYLNKENESIYYSRNDIRVKTFEPFHEMMEKATKNNYKDRIGIEECIGYLEDQMAIIKETVDETRLDQMLSKEVFRFASSFEPDVKHFNSSIIISQSLYRLSEFSFVIKVVEFGERRVLGVLSGVEELTEENDYCIYFYDMKMQRRRQIIIHVLELKMGNNLSVINTGFFNKHIAINAEVCLTIKELLRSDSQSRIINGEFTFELGF